MNTDAKPLPELTERQLHILGALIRAYIQRPEPVSSKQLVEDNDLSVSSATVRNELGVLEQLGMLRSPHTSAGRIPTEEGYRYYVQRLLTRQELSPLDQLNIQAEFEQSARDIQKWIRTAASVLARSTHAAALVTEPRSRAVIFKHMQLIGMHGRLVLLVLVLEGGELSQQMLTLTEEVPQERLSQVAAFINDLGKGQNLAAMRQRLTTISDPLPQEVLELVLEVLSEAEQSSSLALHWYGLGDMLSQFDEAERAQHAIRILDEKAIMQEVISEVIDNDADQVRVMVGGDGRYETMRDLSLVISRYGTRNLAGTISVLGPTRMRYGRAISTVRYVSTLMSAMLQDVYGEES